MIDRMPFFLKILSKEEGKTLKHFKMLNTFGRRREKRLGGNLRVCVNRSDGVTFL